MTPEATLLVPLDGSVPSTAALPVARGLAKVLHATLTVLYVSDDTVPPHRLVDRLHLSPDDVRGFVIDQCSGPVAAAIVQEAVTRRPAFIVMCSLLRRGIAGRTFGSVAEAVLRAAPCPVVLVAPDRPHDPWTLGRVLLPHDGTPTSALAIPPAIALASRAGAELVVLHVASPRPERSEEPGTLRTPRYIDQPQHEWPAWGREFLGRIRALGGVPAGANIRLMLAGGDVGTAVVDFARHNATDLIVVAWRGQLERDRAVAMRRMIREAGCPVLVFRVAR